MTLPENPSLEALTAYAARENIRLSADGGTLRYDAPARCAGPRLEAALRRHKPALLARLAGGAEHPPAAVDAKPPSADARPPAVEERAPVSREQAGMVMRHEQSGEPQVWNVALRIRLEGPLNVRALGDALQTLVHRHHALRSRYVRTGGAAGQGGARQAEGGGGAEQALVQEVLAPGPVPFPVEDLRPLRPEERAQRLESACDRIAQTPFDVARGVEPRVALFRTGPQSSTLMVVLHHISCDGWSLGVLLRELGTLYRNAAGHGPPRPLAPPTAQCTDYARRQASSPLSPQEDRRRLDRWADRLTGCSPDNPLPADRPRPAVLSGRGATASAVLPAGLFASLRRFAREAGVTHSSVALAVLALLLHRRSGRDRFVLSTAYANRADPGTDTLVTCTATVLTLPLHVTGRETLAGLSRHVMAQLAAGVADFLPYARIASGLADHHGIPLPGSLPLGATYQNSADLRLDLPGVTATVSDQTGTTSRRECSFHISPDRGDGTAEVHTEFSTDLYREETARGWLTEYVRLLEDRLSGAARAAPDSAEV